MQDFSSAPVRRAHRVSATIPIGLLLEGEESKSRHEAYTVDLSRLGARVRTTFELSPGEMISVIPWGESGNPIRSRVVWVQRSSTAACLAGLEFLGPLPVQTPA